jgi:DNA-binding NtrC family response regulator
MKIGLFEGNSRSSALLSEVLKIAGHHPLLFEEVQNVATFLEDTPSVSQLDLMIVGTQSSKEAVMQVLHHFQETRPTFPLILLTDDESFLTARVGLAGIEILRTPFRLTTLLDVLEKVGH